MTYVRLIPAYVCGLVFGLLAPSSATAQIVLPPVLHFVREQAELPTAETSLTNGGSIAFRTSISAGANPLEIQGFGIVRHEGEPHIGAIYNEGGDNIIARNIVLKSITHVGGRHGLTDKLTLSGKITGNGIWGVFAKVGSGLIELSNTGNAWKGRTELQGGALRIASPNALPTTNLVFTGYGGVLELAGGDFSRNIGTGANEVQWLTDGGFSAFGGTRKVTLNGGDTLTLGGTANFVGLNRTLFLSSRYADAEINFTNAINLGTSSDWDANIHVARGINTAAIARLSGKISGERTLAKRGDGLLYLSNSANDYTGDTIIYEGALRGVPGSSIVHLWRGVLGLDSDFTRALGDILWHWAEGSAGFAAYGGVNRIVRIGDTTDEITWSTEFFVQTSQGLRFGHYTADAAVIWDRALNFGHTMRTIHVERGQSTTNLVDVIFNQALKNDLKAGGLRLVGNGISGAQLWLTSKARLGSIGTIILSEGGLLHLNNQAGSSFENGQIADTTDITLNTGKLYYTTSTETAEEVGKLILEGGANLIVVDKQGDPTGELKMKSLQRDGNSRSTLNIHGDSSQEITGVNLSFEGSLAEYVIGGIIPWAVNSLDELNEPHWITASGDNHRLVAFSSYDNDWTSSSNTSAAANTTLSAATTINSLRMLSGQLTLNAALTLNSGGLLTWGKSAGIVFSGSGTVTTAQNRPLYLHTSGASLTFNGTTRFTGGMDLVKGLSGVFRYNSTGTSQIGSLYIHQGTVELNKGAFHTGANGQVYIGDGAGHAKLVINGGTNRLASKPKLTLRGTPYGRGAEFGENEAQATLAITNGAQQTLSELIIIDRGTIDFSGGSLATPNRLFLDELTFANDSTQLFVRGWHEFEDYLLLKKTATYAQDMYKWASELQKQIFFDGYSRDYSLLLVDYNADYYQITPWNNSPEPGTYGAILGAVGLGVVAWRRKCKRRANARAEK